MMGTRFGQFPPLARVWSGLLVLMVVSGCGSTKSRLATEQLVMSDAVDQAVSEIDFRPLSGRRAFLDTKYAQNVKGTVGNVFVNADYIISSVRQQMVASDCRLVDSQEQADLIVELRIGTLGTDANDMVYGLPASNAVSGAASLVPNAPVIPPMPEISVAKREAQLGAAKIALFAYDRETRRPVWQSGIAKAKSSVQDVWVLGAGPFQRGSSVEGTQFAGTKLRLPRLKDDGTFDESLPIAYEHEHVFAAPMGGFEPGPVKIAGFVSELPSGQQPASEAKVTPAAKPAPGAKEKGKPEAATTVPSAPSAAPAVLTPPPAPTAPASPPAATTAAESSNDGTSPEGGEQVNISDKPK